jgi:uncharacterized protein involved in propanediol utilization
MSAVSLLDSNTELLSLDETMAGIEAGAKGVASVQGHHGEFLQGVFEVDGHEMPGLVTVPRPGYETTATFVFDGLNGVRSSSDIWKARKSSEITLQRLGLGNLGGYLSIDSPIRRGRGLGSSTADVIAAARAVAEAANIFLTAEQLGSIAVDAEFACDSLMYEKPTLYAQRRGLPIEVFASDLPPMTILSVEFDAEGPGVETLSLEAPQYSAEDKASFNAMRGALRRALKHADPALIARISTVSSRINNHHRPSEGLGAILENFAAWGALGVQCAHSGTVVGVICKRGDAATISVVKNALGTMGAELVEEFHLGA